MDLITERNRYLFKGNWSVSNQCVEDVTWFTQGKDIMVFNHLLENGLHWF